MVAPSTPVSLRRPAYRLPRLLLAVFTLLGATHCVEIDDRELEEHGPGGSDVCNTEGQDECGVCIRQTCCTEFANCVGNSDCLALSDCMYNCGNTTECVDYCVPQYPDGAVPFADYLSCSSSYCSLECS